MAVGTTILALTASVTAAAARTEGPLTCAGTAYQ
jgi:hypothetical protein